MNDFKHQLKINNEKYRKFINHIINLENKLEKHPEDEELKKEIKNLYKDKKQFMYDYGQLVTDFILQNYENIKPKDLKMFDVVPYLVWFKVKEKALIIINKIAEK